MAEALVESPLSRLPVESFQELLPTRGALLTLMHLTYVRFHYLLHQHAYNEFLHAELDNR
jgi:hypothetical protein